MNDFNDNDSQNTKQDFNKSKKVKRQKKKLVNIILGIFSVKDKDHSTELSKLMQPLEPRFMFDGAAVETVDIADGVSESEQSEILKALSSNDNADASDSLIEAIKTEALNQETDYSIYKEVVIIDSRVKDPQTLIKNISRKASVEVIDVDESGVDAIAQMLQKYSNLDAVHIISHGSQGELYLGTSTLNLESLASYQTQLAQWGSAISTSGDLLFYGCNVAEGSKGMAFIDALKSYTDADIAASTDITGADHLGGDSILEVSESVETKEILLFNNYSHTLVPSITNISPQTYIEQQGNITLDADITINDNKFFDNGYIEFEITTGNSSSDTLSFNYDATISNISGEVSILSDGNIYIGNGTGNDFVGSIDSILDGQNGSALRINFTESFINPDFEADPLGSTSLTGWVIGNEQVVLGTDSIAGFVTPADPTKTSFEAVINSAQAYAPDIFQTFSSSDVSNTGDTASVNLRSSALLDAPYGGLYNGPYIYSDSTVKISVGDQISFEWRAEGGADQSRFDAYNVFAYMLRVSDGYSEIVLDETAASRASATNWSTETHTMSQSGEYRFVFVAGSWDETAGAIAGASLFVDNVNATNLSSLVPDTAVTLIAQRVQYSNNSDNPILNKEYTVRAKNGDQANIAIATETLTITPINDPIIINTPAAPAAINEGNSVAFSGFTITDADAGDIAGVDDITASIYLTNLDGAVFGSFSFTAGAVIVGGSDGSSLANAITFTGTKTDVQAALNSLSYYAPDDDTVDDSYTLNVDVTDNGNIGSPGPTTDSTAIQFGVNNLAPISGGTLALTVSEASTGNVITSANINFTDVITDIISYEIITAPSNGVLRNINTSLVLVAGSVFTQSDLDSGYIVYDHDGSQTSADSFTFIAFDEDGGINNNAGLNYSFNISVIPSVSIATIDDLALEAGSDPGQFIVDLGRINNTGGDVTVNYTVSGTATGGDDYAILSGSVAIANGLQTALINVTGIVDDALIEGDETVVLTLDSTDNALFTIGAANLATVTITDNDSGLVSIAATTASATEPGGVGNDGQFTVTLSNPSDTDTVISYSVTGDATAGSDYTTLTGTVTIVAGATTATIDVSVLDDFQLEDNETVVVTLDSITSGDAAISIGALNSDTVTIADDDTAEVTIAATTASATEPGGVGNDGQFTVTLSNPSDTDTVISYSVTGDATAGSDYTTLTGTVTIVAGATTATID
ncbi:DUF4347 domain-containing protein, partial [Thiotrichales bacterium 19S3-11]|nr:DUF4347 domain-containing protein [Thiotrichales bacterium 19S3-11]